MSRPNITDDVVAGLDFARACVLDQQASSHERGEFGWDARYAAALDAIASVVGAHQKAMKKAAKKVSKKTAGCSP